MSMPGDTVPASTPQDAEAIRTIRGHHAELADGVASRVEALLGAVEQVLLTAVPHGAGGKPAGAAGAELVSYCRQELVPHAQAEETTLYAAAARLPGMSGLVATMTAQHAELQNLIAEAEAQGAVRAAASGRALGAVFGVHLALENELLLPALAAAPEVSLADLVRAMEEDVRQRQRAGASSGEVARGL